MILFFYEEEYATELSEGVCKGIVIAEGYVDAMRKLKGTDDDKYSISVKLIPVISETSLKGEHMQLSMSFDDSASNNTSISNDNYRALLSYLKNHID